MRQPLKFVRQRALYGNRSAKTKLIDRDPRGAGSCCPSEQFPWKSSPQFDPRFEPTPAPIDHVDGLVEQPLRLLLDRQTISPREFGQLGDHRVVEMFKDEAGSSSRPVLMGSIANPERAQLLFQIRVRTEIQ